MIPIVKGKEPAALTKAKRAIRNTPDTTFNYTALRGESKREVLEALLAGAGLSLRLLHVQDRRW